MHSGWLLVGKLINSSRAHFYSEFSNGSRASPEQLVACCVLPNTAHGIGGRDGGMALCVECASDLPAKKRARFLAGLCAWSIDANGASQFAHAQGRSHLRHRQ